MEPLLLSDDQLINLVNYFGILWLICIKSRIEFQTLFPQAPSSKLLYTLVLTSCYHLTFSSDPLVNLNSPSPIARELAGWYTKENKNKDGATENKDKKSVKVTNHACKFPQASLAKINLVVRPSNGLTSVWRYSSVSFTVPLEVKNLLHKHFLSMCMADRFSRGPCAHRTTFSQCCT